MASREAKTCARGRCHLPYVVVQRVLGDNSVPFCGMVTSRMARRVGSVVQITNLERHPTASRLAWLSPDSHHQSIIPLYRRSFATLKVVACYWPGFPWSLLVLAWSRPSARPDSRCRYLDGGPMAEGIVAWRQYLQRWPPGLSTVNKRRGSAAK